MVAYLPLTEGRAWVSRALEAAPDVAPQHRAWALLTAGWIANDQVDLESAEAFLTDAVTLAREVGDENLLVHGMLFLGHTALERGDLARAWVLLTEARTRTRALERDPPDPVRVAWAAGRGSTACEGQIEGGLSGGARSSVSANQGAE